MPRPLHEQVIVITGASSGIGRESAVRLAARGAAVVLAARNREALDEVKREIDEAGGTALIALTDVSQWPAVERLANIAIDRFGRIDTWVNNAGVYYVGPIETMSIDDFERLMHVNLFGQLYGVKAALPHFIEQGHGGFINVSSGLGVRSSPQLTAYSASKHAIRALSEGLRLEMERDHPEITVSEILPASINTPLFEHARARIGVKPRPIPPVYAPREVAKAIEFVAEHPRRDVYIGPMRGYAVAEGVMPGVVDRMMRTGDLMTKITQTDQLDDGRDNFYAPMPAETYSTTGEWGRETMPISFTTRLTELHPWGRRAAFGAAALGAAALIRRQMAA